MKTLFYDTEIAKCIPSHVICDKYEYCKGWDDFENMGISVISYYADWRYKPFFAAEILDKNYRSPKAVENSKEYLQSLIDQADRIVGFNSESFDDNLLLANGFRIKTNYDLLCEIREASGQPRQYIKGKTRAGYNLNNLAQTNLTYSKTSTGEDAPKLWQSGYKNQVIEYCKNDVKIIKDLYDKRFELLDPTDSTKILKCRACPKITKV